MQNIFTIEKDMNQNKYETKYVSKHSNNIKILITYNKNVI